MTLSDCRNLGQFDVNVQWTPPESAKPGDMATLKFMHSVMTVYVPEQWQPGAPLLFAAPSLPSPATPKREWQPASWMFCEQLCGVATACAGVFGLFAGSVYMSTIIPGTLGFSLGFSLLLVAVGLWLLFERLGKRAQSFSQLQAVLLATAILAAGSSLGVTMVQVASNFAGNGIMPAIVAAWVVGHDAVMLAAVTYMRTLPRLGDVGRRSATSFLPWFIIVASCIVMGLVCVVLLVSCGEWYVGHMLVHGVALVVAAQAVSVGCMAPRFDRWLPATQTDSMVHPDSHAVSLLPGIASALVVLLLCALSAINTSLDSRNREQRALRGLVGIGQRWLYTVGFLVLLAAGRLLYNILCGRILILQAACLVALGAMAHVAPAFWEPWLVAALAFLAVQCASLVGSSRQTQPELEAHEAITGEEGAEAVNEEASSFRSLLSLLFQELVVKNYKDTLRLAGVLIICAVAALRSLSPFTIDPGHAETTMARIFSITFPAILLMFHALIRGLRANWFEEVHGAHWNAPAAALLGIVVVAVPVRFVPYSSSGSTRLMEAAMWDASLVVYPAVIFGLSRAMVPTTTPSGLGQATVCVFVTALCLLSLSAFSPAALAFHGGVVFAAAWRLRDTSALLLASLLWACRGALGIQSTLDEHLLVGLGYQGSDWLTATLVAVVTCFSALAGILRTNSRGGHEAQDFLPGAFLGQLLLVYFVCVFEWMSLLPMLCAILCLELRPRWDTCLVCGAVIFCGLLFGTSVSWPSLATALVMSLVAARMTFSSGEDRLQAATVAWVFATACGLLAEGDVMLVRCLAALPLATFSIALFATPLPLLQPAFYMLPGLWVLQLLHGVGFNDACFAALVVGGALMVVPAMAGRLPRMLGGVSHGSTHLANWLETAGLAWVIVGTWLALYWRDDFLQALSVALLMSVGMVELVLGLTYARLARARRMGGLLSISVGIFLAAGMAAGLLQGLLTLLGSLMTIGMAVLVATSREADTEPEADEDGIGLARRLTGGPPSP